jgi:hypothetical protein
LNHLFIGKFVLGRRFRLHRSILTIFID